MNDRYPFSNRDPFVSPIPITDKEALDVVNKLAAGERVEMDPIHRDLGEFVEDGEIIVDGFTRYLAEEDKK